MHGSVASIFVRGRKIGPGASEEDDRQKGGTLMAASGEVVMIGNDAQDEVSLLDVLDHVLTAGVVIHGSLVISLAGVDLIYVGLNVVLTSVETALRQLKK